MKNQKSKDCPNCGTKHGSKNCPTTLIKGSSNTTSMLIPMVLVSAAIALFVISRKKENSKETVKSRDEQSFEPVSFGLS